MWFVQSVRLCWRKHFFFTSCCCQLEIVFGLRMGACISTSLLNARISSCFDQWGPWACCHGFYKFILKPSLLYLEGLFPWYLASVQAFTIFLPLPPQSSLSPREGIWWRHIIKTVISGSLTLCSLSKMDLCICSHLLQKEASLIMAHQGVWSRAKCC